VLPPGKIKSALSFMFLYMLLLVMGCTILTSMGWDTDTALGSSLSCLSNIGPGTGHTGPAGTYALMSDAAKLMLSFFMLVGRLEFYTILFLFMPEFWRMK
jgi:trk system potassium uptake protein TrkH